MASGLQPQRTLVRRKRAPRQPATGRNTHDHGIPHTLTLKRAQLLYAKATLKASLSRGHRPILPQIFLSYRRKQGYLPISLAEYPPLLYSWGAPVNEVPFVTMKVLSGRGIHTRPLINTRGRGRDEAKQHEVRNKTENRLQRRNVPCTSDRSSPPITASRLQITASPSTFSQPECSSFDALFLTNFKEKRK